MNEKRKTVVYDTINPNIVNQNNNIHVAFVFGGMSKEREVSLLSKPGLLGAIHELGYKVTPIDMGCDIASHLESLKPDVVYNGLYGQYGEDGCLQGLLEIMGTKYTHSGLMTSAVGMDKVFSTDILVANGILCPDRIIIEKKDNIKSDPMSRPYVIKPKSEGSSVGVELIFPEDEFNFSEYKWEYGDSMLVERYIPGQEIQVAVLDGKAMGIVEIEPLKRRFYDYDTKYKDGMAQHHLPARINDDAYNYCLNLSEKIYKIFNCKSVARLDFRYNKDEGKNGKFYFLEINTHPGMTPLSLVPEICTYKGINFHSLVDKIIQDGLK